MKTILTALLFILSLSLYAQERMLLRIGPNGQQEAIPLKKGEHAKDVIERLEHQRTSMLAPGNSAGMYDTLKYFSTASDLTTNFGFTHQDVALQWYVPQAGGGVTEFWWYNYQKQGVIKKGTIRAWHIDPRVAGFPSSPNTKFLGTYKDAADGDGGVQPFKPSTGDQWFYSNGAADSATYSFDPMQEESSWLKGGLQVTLDSNVWQGIKLSDFGDTFAVRLGEPFGFTISNDTKKGDVGAAEDTRMEILSVNNSVGVPPNPFHSLKFYETGRTAPSNAGWHLRGDYEWGMYVVVEYCTDRPPRFIVDRLGSTFNTNPRKVNATIDGISRCYGPYEPIAYVYLHFKAGSETPWDSVMMSQTDISKYNGSIPGYSPGDKVYYKVSATTTFGTRLSSPVLSYSIIGGSKTKSLFIYNNAGYSKTNANLIYLGTYTPTDFDYWSVPNDGTTELSTLMALYTNIVIADGFFPSRNIYTALKGRLAAATDMAPVSLFFTSQDYGCYIQGDCADTTFTSGTMEYDYFGISKLGPQDLPPTNREFRIVPLADTVTNYLIKFGADSGSTLWYDPTYELGFSGYPDAMTPRPEAKALFKDGGTNVVGVKYITPSTRVMYLGFDAGALQFRSDTSLEALSDPKYKWIPTDVGSLTLAFFKAHSIPLSVNPVGGSVPSEFTLRQNYPNPFNPSTTIEYSVPVHTTVEIALFNILGQKVTTVVNQVHDAGSYRHVFNASNMASGIYFYTLKANNFRTVRSMVLLR
jgi:hypothetical protein